MVNKKLFFLTRQIQIKGFQKELKIQSIIKFTCIIVILLLFNLLLISCGGHCERDTDCPGAKICAGYESLFWDGRVCVYSDKDLVLASDNTCTETENTCIDLDQDGFEGTGNCDREFPQFDCNDNREDIYPGAVEICDTFDNDCNGFIDAQDPNMIQKPCEKQIGVCENSTRSCIQGEYQWCSDTEYRSNSEFYVPVEEGNELLCDNLDNDCDGQQDEEIEKSCYSGPEDTAGVGICSAGRQRCENGAWAECVDDQIPEEEICDNLDNNCDGQRDEGVEESCYSGPQETMGFGICRAGTRRCENGDWTECLDEQIPEEETCENVDEDNDCDNILDNVAEVGNLCINEELMTCREGIFQCVDGVFSCVMNSVELLESCNSFDDDCDSQIDNAVYCEPTLSCGDDHCCVLVEGVAHCWGSNDRGESSPPDHIFKSITAGSNYTCGLFEDNTVECWGAIEGGPEGEFIQIDAGYSFVCGLKSDDTAECWGINFADHTSGSNVVAQLVVGLYSVCTLTINGQVECTRCTVNINGQVE